MSDASAPPSPDRQPDQAPGTDPAHAAEIDPNAGPPSRADHHGLVAFLGVVALILLLVGAVGAAGMTGRSGSDRDEQAATPGQGHAYGQQKRAEKAERHAQREAEKRARKERRQELKEQRQQGGAMRPDVAEALSEQTGTIATQPATDGTTAYVLQTATGTVVLDVGPPRYWGENHPLAPLVGQTVTVTGVQKAGADRFAVFTVNDQVIRDPGRPPWAGGWKADGQKAPTTSPSPSAGPTP